MTERTSTSCCPDLFMYVRQDYSIRELGNIDSRLNYHRQSKPDQSLNFLHKLGFRVSVCRGRIKELLTPPIDHNSVLMEDIICSILQWKQEPFS